jgi:hypothetical protein
MRRPFYAAMLLGVFTASCPWTPTATGAAPAASSYVGVEKSVESIRQAWSRPGAQDLNAPGWESLFTALLGDLREYSQAQSPTARLTPLYRIYQMSLALGTVDWPPAAQVREELRQWLRPRVRLAWAEQRLEQTVRNLPPTSDSQALANRQRWVDFVDNDLGQALAQYGQATTVSQRQQALDRVHQALKSLRARNADRPWQPAYDLQAAVSDLFNQPNLDITADVSVVSPLFDQNLVTSGPVYRKGYWSQVTAGPKTGFGLLPSDDGIQFYNSQMLTSSTPIYDFQNKLEQDPQGRRAAKLYCFSLTSIDAAQLTVYTALRSNGLALAPAYNHNIDAQICSAPAPGGGLTRGIAGLIGMNQNKITQMVYEGALKDLQQRIPQEAQEEAQERIAVEAGKRNADLSKYLIGNNMAAVQNFLITGLSLRSRPEAVYVGGLLQSRTGEKQRGADAPQPTKLVVPDAGLTADVHLNSVLTSAVAALLQRPDVQLVENVMILTKDVPPGTPPKEAVTIRVNVDFPTYAKVADQTRRANNPKVAALRIKRPSQPPEFASDARGFLVAILRDVEIDVPAPDPKSQAGSVIGVPAQTLRIKIPQLEAAFSYQVETPAPLSHRVKAKLEDFTPAPTSEVLAINGDEARATRLSRFSGALVLSALAARLRSQPIDANLDNLKLRGFAIQSISPLDPTGWVRVNLVRVPESAPATVAAVPAVPAS